MVFDLGGVLVRLGGVRDFGDLLGEAHDGMVWRQPRSSRSIAGFSGRTFQMKPSRA